MDWQFTETCANSGELTYRCIVFNIDTCNDEFTDSELGLIRGIVDCLNANYKEPADEIDDD